MIDYLLVAGIILYFVLLKAVSSSNLKPVTATLIFGIGYFSLQLAAQAILLSSSNQPLTQLLQVSTIATMLLQISSLLFVFIKIDNDESEIAPLLWGATGFVTIFFIAPWIGQQLVG